MQQVLASKFFILSFRSVAFLLCLIATSLTGCALFKPEPIQIRSAVEQKTLYEFESWWLGGRIVVVTNKETWHAGLSWKHEAVEDTLDFSGPLGQGAVKVTLKNKQIRIKRSDGSLDESGDSDEILAAYVGLPVPIAAFRYWVIGLPAPSVKHIPEYDDLGRLRLLRQSGWQIKFQSYAIFDDLSLPRKLVVEREDVKMKLIIDRWRRLDQSS